MSYQWQRVQLLGIMKSCISSEVLLPLSNTNLTLTLFLATFYTNIFNIKGLSFVLFFINQYIAVFLTASKPVDRVCFKIRSNSFLVSPQESAPLRLLSALLNGLVFLQLRVNAFGGKIGPNMDLFLELFASCLVLWG